MAVSGGSTVLLIAVYTIKQNSLLCDSALSKLMIGFALHQEDGLVEGNGAQEQEVASLQPSCGRWRCG